ncbi:hypothetical protein D3C76_1668450 [compost metagenome]
MARRGLVGRAEERLAQLRQVLTGYARAMVAHAQHDFVAVTLGLELDGQSLRVEPQGIAQQVIQCTFKHGRPALQAQPGLFFKAYFLIRRT